MSGYGSVSNPNVDATASTPTTIIAQRVVVNTEKADAPEISALAGVECCSAAVQRATPPDGAS